MLKRLCVRLLLCFFLHSPTGFASSSSNTDITTLGVRERTALALFEAIEKRDCVAVNEIAFAANFEIRHVRNPDAFEGRGASLLALAIPLGFLPMIDTLVAWGCNVDEEGLTALAETPEVLSSIERHKKISSDKGPASYIYDLFQAVSANDVIEVQNLAKAYAIDLKTIRNIDDHLSLLHMAAGEGHGEMMEFLIKSGCDLNNRDNILRVTPLEYAFWCGHAELGIYLHIIGVIGSTAQSDIDVQLDQWFSGL